MDPITRPIPVEIGAPQIEDGLRPFRRPAHAGALHAILDQIPTGPFGDARSDRLSGRQTFLIAHLGAIVVDISNDVLEGLAVEDGP